MYSPIRCNTIEGAERGQVTEQKVKSPRKYMIEGASCRICFGGEEDGHLFSPCKCAGTMKYVHVECLQRWRAESSNIDSYFRCEQCLYRYNLRRVTANRFLGLSFIVPLLTLLIMLGGWALIGFICYLSFGADSLTEMFGLPPLYASAFAGLCVIGLAGFVLMAFVEGGPDMRDPCGCGADIREENRCNWCCAGDCNLGAWDVPSNAEGCLALAAALLVVVVVGYGVIGTIAFVYSRIHSIAVGTRDRLSTVVLEVGSSTNPLTPQRILEKTPLISHLERGISDSTTIIV